MGENNLTSIKRRPFLKATGVTGSTIIAGQNVAANQDVRQEPDDQGENSTKPHVHLVGTGGTIANTGGSYENPESFLTADELIEEVPELSEPASLTSTGITRVGSSSLFPEVWYDTYDEIMTKANSENPPDGFVVTHGSNTSEETAYFLNLTLKTDLPVVVTAAQRSTDALGTDAYKNLYDAIRVAATPEAKGRGTMIVANDEIHHSRDVTKLASARPDAWESPNFGKIGLASPEQPITFYRDVERPVTTDTEFDLDGTTVDDFPLTDIQVVFSALGSDGSLVEAAIENGAKGIVVAGFLTGSAAGPVEGSSQEKSLEKAASQGIPVVMCTRGIYGRIVPDDVQNYSDYGIAGDTLRPQKARILLALGLMKTDSPGELQEMFDTY